MVKIALVVAIGIAFFSFLTYVFLVNYSYKALFKNKISIKNQFLFETCPHHNGPIGYVNYIQYFSYTLVLGLLIYNLVYRLSVTNVIFTILAVIYIFCLVFIPLVSFNHLKEHFYLDLGAMMSLFAMNVFNCFESSRYLRYEYNLIYLIPLILSAILTLISLYFVFRPGLFSFKNERDSEGNIIRAKYIPLALVERALYLLFYLSIIPLILIAVI